MSAFLFLVTLAMLAVSAFCSGTETSFLSVSRERVLHLARAGGRKARSVQAALAEMSRTMTTILIGNNLANVAYSSATAALIVEHCRDSIWRSVWSFIAAFVVLYVSEFLPKILCAARPLRRSLQLAPTYAVMAAILHPLTNLALTVTNVFFRNRRDERYQPTTADLVRILQDRKDGVKLSDFESALIGRLIVLRAKGRAVTREAIMSAVRDFD